MSDVGSEHDAVGANQATNVDENGGAEDNRPLDAGEIGRLRLVLDNLEALEQTLHTLIRDQTSLTEAVAAFATRTERRQNQNMEQIKANQALLHEVINQIQSFAVRSDEETASQRADLTSLRAEMESLQQTVQIQGLHGAGQSTNSPSMTVSDDELYADWDVVGQLPPHTPNFTNTELEQRISMCLKQKETPMYGGANDDDIDVYVLNMISWYAAYGLYLAQAQVDWRVGELMLNHTKGKAKKWLLQDYKGQRRWSHIVKKMKQRFVTRSREEDLVASFFDCNQGNRPLDAYIDEFQRLGRTDDVSEKFKMIKFKKGLRSTQLKELLKTQTYESLEGLVDAARSFNPRDPATESQKTGRDSGPSSNKKKPAPAKSMPAETGKCSSTRCLEKGHTKDKCWMLHPELRPAWFKEGGGRRAGAAAATASTRNSAPQNDNRDMWSVLNAIQTDLAKIKSDLN